MWGFAPWRAPPTPGTPPDYTPGPMCGAGSLPPPTRKKIPNTGDPKENSPLGQRSVWVSRSSRARRSLAGRLWRGGGLGFRSQGFIELGHGVAAPHTGFSVVRVEAGEEPPEDAEEEEDLDHGWISTHCPQEVLRLRAQAQELGQSEEVWQMAMRQG